MQFQKPVVCTFLIRGLDLLYVQEAFCAYVYINSEFTDCRLSSLQNDKKMTQVKKNDNLSVKTKNDNYLFS